MLFAKLHCPLQAQGRMAVQQVFLMVMHLSVSWRVFLVLYAEGLVLSGRPNLRLFSQLFWLLFTSMTIIIFSIFPGDLLWRGQFPQVGHTVDSLQMIADT